MQQNPVTDPSQDNVKDAELIANALNDQDITANVPGSKRQEAVSKRPT